MPPAPQAAAGTAPGPSRAGSVWAVLACVLLGLGFGLAVWLRRGPEPAQQYLAGYLIELSLSVDNVFVFALVFRHFGVDPLGQRRLLLWGIVGAVVLRSAFILAGIGAIARFAWIVPFFGAFILATAGKLALARPEQRGFDPSKGALVRFASAHAPRALAALLVLETADLVFAMDSLPAVIAVTHDPVLAIASNLFAILGLRSLFLVVSSALQGLRYLNAGLSAVLAFVGLKMLAQPWFQVPTPVALAVIAGFLALSVGASLLARRGRASPGAHGEGR